MTELNQLADYLRGIHRSIPEMCDDMERLDRACTRLKIDQPSGWQDRLQEESAVMSGRLVQMKALLDLVSAESDNLPEITETWRPLCAAGSISDADYGRLVKAPHRRI